jgi:hypothetical protein
LGSPNLVHFIKKYNYPVRLGVPACVLKVTTIAAYPACPPKYLTVWFCFQINRQKLADSRFQAVRCTQFFDLLIFTRRSELNYDQSLQARQRTAVAAAAAATAKLHAMHKNDMNPNHFGLEPKWLRM